MRSPRPAPVPYVPPAGGYDEAVAPDGTPRAGYATVLEAVAESGPTALAGAVREALDAAGCVFQTAAGPEPFVVDPVPRLLGASEWAALETGLVQRLRALEAFIADAYGEQRVVRDGVLPEGMLEGARNFEPDLRGWRPPAGIWVPVAGLDCVRGADGRLRLLEDNLKMPSGLAYLLAARTVVEPRVTVSEPVPRPLGGVLPELRAALAGAAPAGCSEPQVVLLTDGPGASAYWEHRRLAAATGIPLVEPRDLRRRGDRVALAASGETVDVVYRRTDDHRLRGPDGRPSWLADLFLEPLRAGTVAVVNAFGTGVADDKRIAARAAELIRYYLGEEPLLPGVPTFDLEGPAERQEALDRLAELVFKPRAGFGGHGVVIGPRAGASERARLGAAVRAHPDRWIAQELVELSTHPTVVDAGLEPRHVDLRPFVLSTPGARHVVPGALTRVALDQGQLVVNSSRGGGAKDTWVLRGDPE